LCCVILVTLADRRTDAATHALGLRNATALPDQQHRRFVIADGLGWSAAEDKCKALGVGLCPVAKVCLEKDAKREKKDKLKTGGATSRLTQELCMGKGVQSASSKTKQKDFGSVCTNKERQDLLGRWLPVVDADRHVWANLKTCEIKTSSQGEKERGVVACCGGGQHAGIFAAVHPPSVIQFAEKMVEKQNNKATKVRFFFLASRIIVSSHLRHPTLFLFSRSALPPSCLGLEQRRRLFGLVKSLRR
jgi:hypothetical protein